MRHAWENMEQHCYIKDPSGCNWVAMRDMKADSFAIPGVKQNKDILLLYEVWFGRIYSSHPQEYQTENIFFLESILWFSVRIWHTRYTRFILVTVRKLKYHNENERQVIT